MDVVAGLIKLKTDAMHSVEAWQQEINARKHEAIETLKNEGVTIESWFHINIEGSDYLMVYMRAHDIQKAQQVAKHSQSDIDAFHHEFKKVWGERIMGRLLVDLNCPEA